MYKDDNFMTRDGCSEALLRMMLDGKGNCQTTRAEAPSCRNGAADHASKWGLQNYPLASVFAPLQDFEDLYDLDVALERGTIFSALDLPFEGRTISKGGCRNG